MCIHRMIIRSFLTVLLLTAASLRAQAVQYAYTTYALGESAFSAGLTPPPGIYVSTVIGTYDGKLAGTADFGGVTINAAAKADIGGVASLVGITGGVISGLSKPSQNRWL